MSVNPAARPPVSTQLLGKRSYVLTDVSRLLLAEWLSTGYAVGSAVQCARRLAEYLDAGADELVLHGATPDLLGPLVAHTRHQRVQPRR